MSCRSSCFAADEMPPAATSSVPVKSVLTVFWSGTAFGKRGAPTLVEAMALTCKAVDISDDATDIALAGSYRPSASASSLRGNDTEYVNHFKMCVDGCAVTNGFLGMLFGAGIAGQAEDVKRRALEIVHRLKSTLILNLVGFSRGAIGCLRTAKLFEGFGDKWRDWISINVLAIDPVPGNFITTTKCDFLGISHNSRSEDLTECALVRHALVLFTVDPMPHSLAHAPSVPKFANGVGVVDVMLGCHAGAMFVPRYISLLLANAVEDEDGAEEEEDGNHVASLLKGDLSPTRMYSVETWAMCDVMLNFLNAHGTHFSAMADRVFPSDAKKMLAKLVASQGALHYGDVSTRLTHDKHVSVRRRADGVFLNKLHQVLHFENFQDSAAANFRERPYYFGTMTHFSDYLCLYAD